MIKTVANQANNTKHNMKTQKLNKSWFKRAINTDWLRTYENAQADHGWTEENWTNEALLHELQWCISKYYDDSFSQCDELNSEFTKPEIKRDLRNNLARMERLAKTMLKAGVVPGFPKY